MAMKETSQILLYYKYVRIEDPQALMISQKELCDNLDLKGRIIVAHEGINGTVEGSVENTEKYIEEMRQDSRFADIHFKKSIGDGNSFPRASVKVRSEIVSGHLGGDDVNPAEMTGKRLSPDELKSWFESGKEFEIVDMRNDYEQHVGIFKGTTVSGMKNFRDLPETAEKMAPLKKKTVLTVCTGGVRCEKASGYLVKKGFEDVYQLDGGIVSYIEKYPGADFMGSLYVFDNRKVMSFDAADQHTVIGRCQVCQAPSEQYVNCAQLNCHDHFICCEKCRKEESALCIKCHVYTS